MASAYCPSKSVLWFEYHELLSWPAAGGCGYEILGKRHRGLRASVPAALPRRECCSLVCFQLWSMALIKEGFCLWFRQPLNIVAKHFLSIKGFPLISACSQLPVSLGELCTWIVSLINVTLFLMPGTLLAWLGEHGALQWKHRLQPIRDVRSGPFALVMEIK